MSLNKIFNRSFLLFLFVFLVSFAFTPSVFAETVNDIQIHGYVENIKLDKNTYTAGDTVTGTFVLYTDADVAVPEMYYTVSLAGDYQPDTLAGIFYDTKYFGPIFLNPHERKTVDFSYVLPKGVDGKGLGIQIQARSKIGNSMGWSDAFLTITGGLPMVTVTDASLLVNNKNFALQVGPTIKKGDTSVVTISVKNPSSASITLVPHVKYYDRAVTQQFLLESALDQVTLKAGQISTVKINVPVFDGKAGVYIGVVTFPDLNNIERAPAIGFRYIVAGSMVTIQNIVSDKQYGIKGDVVTVHLSMTGSPYDIVTYKIPETGEVSVSVTLLNEKNATVAQYNQSVANGQINLPLQIPLTLSQDAGFLKAQVVVSQNNQILASTTVNLSEKNYTVLTDNYFIPIVLSALILALVFALYVWRSSHSKKNAIIVWGLLLLIACTFALVVGLKYSLAGYTEVWNLHTNCGKPGIYCFGSSYMDNGQPVGDQIIYNPTVVTNPISVNSTGKFAVTGTTYAVGCTNQSGNLFFLYNLVADDATHWKTGPYYSVSSSNYGTAVNSHFANFSTQFSIPNLTASTVPGSYQVWLKAVNYRYVNNGTQTIEFGNSRGYTTYTVPVPPACTYTYTWSGSCINDIENQTYTAAPAGCVGTALPAIRHCCSNGATNPPTCTSGIPGTPCSYTYVWGPCVSGTQTQIASPGTPSACVGAPTPASQSCGSTAISYSCQVTGTGSAGGVVTASVGDPVTWTVKSDNGTPGNPSDDVLVTSPLVMYSSNTATAAVWGTTVGGSITKPYSTIGYKKLYYKNGSDFVECKNNDATEAKVLITNNPVVKEN